MLRHILCMNHAPDIVHLKDESLRRSSTASWMQNNDLYIDVWVQFGPGGRASMRQHVSLQMPVLENCNPIYHNWLQAGVARRMQCTSRTASRLFSSMSIGSSSSDWAWALAEWKLRPARHVLCVLLGFACHVQVLFRSFQCNAMQSKLPEPVL